MSESRLGKITKARFGHGGYQDACIGIHFELCGKGWGVFDSKSAWDAEKIEHSDSCSWSESDRDSEYAEIIRYVSKLLDEAKVKRVDDLVGIPVEVSFDGNTLKSWRVLTEVL